MSKERKRRGLLTIARLLATKGCWKSPNVFVDTGGGDFGGSLLESIEISVCGLTDGDALLGCHFKVVGDWRWVFHQSLYEIGDGDTGSCR